MIGIVDGIIGGAILLVAAAVNVCVGWLMWRLLRHNTRTWRRDYDSLWDDAEDDL